MNNTPEQLWTNLIALCATNDAFFFKDFERDGHTFRIFNYRLASYTDFLQPSALECRGIMFEIVEGEKMLRLACRSQEKFFNVYENPMTTNLDFNDMKQVMLKADGSLISTYMIGGKLCLKTKGSLESEQAVAAEAWLNRPENEQFKDQLQCITVRNSTVNMEWCAPDNRIVIGYMKPHLVVLNVRHHDGRYYEADYVKLKWRHVGAHWVETYTRLGNGQEFIDQVTNEKDKEGYVVQLASGQHVKVKTEWYIVQHRAKDSINSPRRLFEAVLEEAIDDLRTLFHTDELVLKRIDDMERLVESIYNPLVAKVEHYYNEHKHWERKEYAIEGMIQFPNKGEFGLVMSLYTGKKVDYKEYLKKQYKNYGIKDEEITEE